MQMVLEKGEKNNSDSPSYQHKTYTFTIRLVTEGKMSYLLLRQLNDAINIQIHTSGKWRILFFPQLSKYGYSVSLGIDW